MTLEETVAIEQPEANNPLVPGPSAAEPFLIFVRVESDRCEIILSGELDLSTAPLLRHRMAEVTGELETELLLDIRALTFIDSTGLSLIVSEHKKLKAQGTELVLVSPSRMARRLFELSGLDSVLSIRSEGHDI
jgi:anti-sigma B factor antagonist